MKYTKFLDLKRINREIIVPAFERATLDKISNSIWECGNFSVLYECTTCGTREWKGFKRCKNKFCVCCNAVKALSWLAKTVSKFEQFLNEGKYIVMLTLTIRDRPDLQEGLKILNKAWRLFYHEDKRISSTFHFKFAGGVKSLEVKTGENSDLWHPHLHVLLVKDRFSYDKMFLDNAWGKCVERAGGVVDEKINYIESIYMRDENGVKKYDKEALVKGIVESVKYISKFDYANEPSERLQELAEALKGVRQIDTFGCCKNIHKDVEEELNEEIKLNEIVEHACQVCGCNEAKLVEMLSDRIDTYEGIVLTDKINLSEPMTGEQLEYIKGTNGKVELSAPKDEESAKSYQATMWDVPEDDPDELDRLFFEALNNDLGDMRRK